MPIDPVTRRSDLDAFAKMPKASWRDIEFVCGPMDWGFTHAHAAHLYPDRDAGYIESTGRNPATFSFTAIFRNGVVGERLQFPTLYQAFTRACMDRTAGDLLHPVLGVIKVKCQSYKASFDVMRRDGADVQVEFIESTDEADELDALLGQNSPMGNCITAARNLDDALGNVSPAPPPLPQSLKPSLLDSIKQLNGAVQQYKLGIGNIAGQIDSYASAIDDLTNTLQALDDPKNYRALDACERMFASLLALSVEVTKKAKPTIPALVPFTTSLAGAAGYFGMTVGAFAKLNPIIAGQTTIPVGTPVMIAAV